MKPIIKDNACDFHIFYCALQGVLANQENQEQRWDPPRLQHISKQQCSVGSELVLVCLAALP